MCEINIYFKENGKEKLFQKEADIIKPQENGLFMKNIFGEQKTIKAKIIEISLIKHKIVIEKV